MIKITALSLSNFGRHKLIKKSNLKGHSIGLAGPSGCGKSSVLQAMQFALTGTIDHSDQLSEFIRRSSDGDAPTAAEVTLEFESDGKIGKIQRRITRTSVTRKLWWDGAEKPLTSDSAVSEVLFNILGVDKKAINSTVFIRQGKMASMFGDTTERRDFYTRLLMLGHCAKIAGSLDGYKATVAGSVQDLGAVKDAAQVTYDAAAAYFNECDDGVAAAPSVLPWLTLARTTHAAYTAHISAEDMWRAASANLASQVASGQSGELWLEAQNLALQNLRRIEKAETERSSRHVAVTSAAAVLELRLSKQERAAAQHARSLTLEAEIASTGAVEENPAKAIKAAQDVLSRFTRFDELSVALPSLNTAAEAAETAASWASKCLSEAAEDLSAARALYATTADALKLRKDLRKSTENAQICSDGCPLCGAPESAQDAAKVDLAIVHYEAQLKETEAQGKVAAAKHAQLQREFTVAQEMRHGGVAALDAAQAEHKRLRVELALTSKEKAQSSLEAATALLPSYHAKADRVDRLTNELSEVKRSLRSEIIPSPEEIETTRAELETNRLERQTHTWSQEDAAKLAETKSSIAVTDSKIKSMQSRVAQLEAAQRRLDQTTETLQAAISAAPEGFYDMTGLSTVLTLQEVENKLRELESAQMVHDTTRGKLEAANESMKQASRRLDELDLRAAEQLSRLRLVDGLGKLSEAFKPTGASLDYLDYRFGQIAQLAGDYLAESGADFMVAPSENVPLSFDFIRTDRPGEVWMRQNRMSGGQKVRLAVATLCAIHALVLPNVGLLVLDEPTTHLDDTAARGMADMLRKSGDDGALQMIVCDHSPALIEAFSDRIDIPEQ